jgi:hypothetical protein
MANLTKGDPYKKSDFNIKFPRTFKTDHIVAGELYSFFNIGRAENNIDTHTDGFVYQVHADHQLIPAGKQTNLHRHIFVRKRNKKDFEYLGESVREENYSPTQNKAFW